MRRPNATTEIINAGPALLGEAAQAQPSGRPVARTGDPSTALVNSLYVLGQHMGRSENGGPMPQQEAKARWATQANKWALVWQGRAPEQVMRTKASMLNEIPDGLPAEVCDFFFADDAMPARSNKAVLENMLHALLPVGDTMA